MANTGNQPPTTRQSFDEPLSPGLSKTALVASWSAVGVFALGCLLFVVWYSASSQQAKMTAAANDRIAAAAALAEEWLDRESGADGVVIEQELSDALAEAEATERSRGKVLLDRVRQRHQQFAEQARIQQGRHEAAALFDDAKRHIDGKRVAEAVVLLHKYVAHPHATEAADAEQLLREAEAVLSETLTLEALRAMSKEDLECARSTGHIDDGRVTHPTLLAVRGETVRRQAGELLQDREETELPTEGRSDGERPTPEAEEGREMPPVVVKTDAEMLDIHEQPARHVGRTVVVEGTLEAPVYVYSKDFHRDQRVGAYLFCFELGVEQFGNQFGPIRGELNYACNTQTGLEIKRRAQGDSLAKFPMVITFRVKEVEGEYYAVAESITPHPILAERQRRLAEAKLEVDLGKAERARQAVWEACERYTFGTEKERDELIWVLAGMTITQGLDKLVKEGKLEAPVLQKVFGVRWEELDGRRVDFHAATVRYVQQFGDHVPEGNNYTIRWLWNEAQLRLKQGK